ncbi:hypothetical protein W97_06599 [Coniosporium apollinis CBS 100218]|uniref:LicD/FKTN/FKRP nucleotidyltransferase domain-containing protein n=1 Tax=Coniosporium apollinis (strain CBS 100218) TaxID=1168221 RepID=R7Z087_CONA1|nr:uncharacterized protein W97_06599 [Coniosporium apollinis CBS 100218]EON67346.1 hypothetical protein W97_06599 [Coniosporium apollinis CBS 100218]
MLRLRFWLLLLTNALIAQALPTQERRDADFASVRTELAHDRSGKRRDPLDKYFHESTFHPHYDGRFAASKLPEEQRKPALTALVQTYFSTMSTIGAQTWIMHGSLLGWYWNRRIMPWDSDVDVQMSEDGMRELAGYYNMTMHNFDFPSMEGDRRGKGRGDAKGKRRSYMIEVNPHYTNASTADLHNVIDARWIDTETGLFIDITTLRRDREAEARGYKGHMYSKDKHLILEDDIFPLRDSVFEGMPVKIPYAYAELLEGEYGRKALARSSVENHRWDRERMEWVKIV